MAKSAESVEFWGKRRSWHGWGKSETRPEICGVKRVFAVSSKGGLEPMGLSLYTKCPWWEALPRKNSSLWSVATLREMELWTVSCQTAQMQEAQGYHSEKAVRCWMLPHSSHCVESLTSFLALQAASLSVVVFLSQILKFLTKGLT